MSDLKQQIIQQQKIVIAKLIAIGVDEDDATMSVMMAGADLSKLIGDMAVKSTDQSYQEIQEDWDKLVELSNQFRSQRGSYQRDTRSDAQVRADTMAKLADDQAREDWYE